MGIFINNRPVRGGIVDKSDKKAAKVIKSETIVKFFAKFYLYGKMGRESDSSYEICFQKENDGKYILSEEKHQISCETDEYFVKNIQKVIVKHNLFSSNGIHRYTQGLPVQYQPSTLRAEYESGEVLSFTVNNDPDSEWAGDILELVGEEFSRHGIKVLDVTKGKQES